MRISYDTDRILNESGFTELDVIENWFRLRLGDLAKGRGTVPTSEIHYIMELSQEMYAEEMLRELHIRQVL